MMRINCAFFSLSNAVLFNIKQGERKKMEMQFGEVEYFENNSLSMEDFTHTHTQKNVEWYIYKAISGYVGV